MVSSTYNEKGINQLLNCTPAELGNFIPAEMESILPDTETLRRHLDSAPKTMADLLDSFESRDICKALSENGFGSEKQKELKDLMTES